MKENKSILILAVWVSLAAFRWDSAPQKVREGNRLFEKKEYGEALRRYREAEVSRPEAPEIPFNMGNSFYRQKEYQKAIQSHQRSLELSSGVLSPKAHYNIGDSLYREGDLKGALESYKKAVDLNPNDFDTKVNIEFIQRKLKEQQQSQKPQESPSQKQKEDEKSEEKKEGEGQNQQPQEGQREKENRPSPSEISKKDAERILGALQSEEKSLSSPKKEGNRRTELDVEKDW